LSGLGCGGAVLALGTLVFQPDKFLAPIDDGAVAILKD
jgi:hypothetical protein